MKLLNYLLLLISLISFSQTNYDLNYFLKNHDTYNQNIPKPSNFTLGNKEIGSSHISHDRLVQYMFALANSSDRITLINRGETFEGRPLILLIITSKKNHQNLESIRKEHLLSLIHI